MYKIEIILYWKIQKIDSFLCKILPNTQKTTDIESYECIRGSGTSSILSYSKPMGCSQPPTPYILYVCYKLLQKKSFSELLQDIFLQIAILLSLNVNEIGVIYYL